MGVGGRGKVELERSVLIEDETPSVPKSSAIFFEMHLCSRAEHAAWRAPRGQVEALAAAVGR